MPPAEDCVNNPLEIVQNIFGKNQSGDWRRLVKEHFITCLADPAVLSKVPSLNCCHGIGGRHASWPNLKSDTLVRFRGTIQDMFDPEYYMEVYHVTSKKTPGESPKLACGRYRDVVDVKPDEEVLMESPRNITDQRVRLYCKAVPWENDWVKEEYSKRCFHSPNNLTTQGGSLSATCPVPSSHSNKRCHEEDKDGGDGDKMEEEDSNVMGNINKESGKKQKKNNVEQQQEHDGSSGTASAPNTVGEDGFACLVKVYEDDEESSLSLNDIVEFIGVLSVDPSLAYMNEIDDGDCSAFLKNEDEAMELEDSQSRPPPPSVLPRLHVLVSYKLKHNNPLLPSPLQPVLQDPVNCAAVFPHLHAVLEMATFGDSLAATYLVCHLISSVYFRKYVSAVGKFSVNLSNIPTNVEYGRNLYSLIELLTTQSCYLPLTLSNLNEKTFTPKKNYQTNKLETGLLQLSANTHLVIDEASLTQGQLNEKGVRNLGALAGLISRQSVSYDFNFHKIDYPADVPTLILSEGKSLLPSDVRISLVTSSSTFDVKSQFDAIRTYLTPALLDDIRRYLTSVKLETHTLPEEVQKIVQDDFVEQRLLATSRAEMMTADDLQSLLLLARLVSLSEGSTSLTKETWEKSKNLELQRKSRL